jgi:hypothetical protein
METKDSKDQYQLVKLTPDQVNELWEQGLKDSIESALPPLAHFESPERMGNVFRELLSGRLECWIVYENENALVIGTFQLLVDEASKTRSLLLYSLYSYKPITLDMWGSMVVYLKQKAKELRCTRIVAYTAVDRVIDIVNALGGSTETRFIWLEV